MKNKVYALYTFGNNLPDINQILKDRAALETALHALAARENETIYMHDYKDDTLGGAPILMVECSDAFVKKAVQSLPLIKDHHDMWDDIETVRRTPILGATPVRKGPKPGL